MLSSRDLPHSGTEPAYLMSPALADGFFTSSAIWEAQYFTYIGFNKIHMNSLVL